MKRISKPTSQYKKDLKRFRHDSALLSDLKVVLALLETDSPLDSKYRDHALVFSNLVRSERQLQNIFPYRHCFT